MTDEMRMKALGVVDKIGDGTVFMAGVLAVVVLDSALNSLPEGHSLSVLKDNIQKYPKEMAIMLGNKIYE